MQKDVYLDKAEIDIQKKYIENIRLMNDDSERKAYIATYGCAQNQTDTDKLYGMLFNMGYKRCENEDNADIIIYNTCSVRENAEVKVYGKIGALKIRKKENPNLIIGVCGCLMQQEHASEKIRKTFRFVDMVFGTHVIHKFPQLLYKTLTSKKRIFDIQNIDGIIAEGVSIVHEKNYKVSIPIAYGCNNFCTYCVVPYTRGRERSRKSEDILNEIKSLCKNGLKEVTLLGQNVNSYGNDTQDDIDFPELLQKICDIDEIKRVRFLTSHPKDLTTKLINTMAQNEKICKSLHLPFQSGNTKVLNEMNRKYTREDYLLLVGKIKKAMPDISLSSDVIVGFPGETTSEFYDTLSLIKEVRFDVLFTFIYSKRENTKSAIMDDPMPYEQKLENFNILLKTQNDISKEINDTYLGKTYEIIDEGFSKNTNDMRQGRCETNKVINYKPITDVCEGDFVKVKVTQCHTWSLNAEQTK